MTSRNTSLELYHHLTLLRRLSPQAHTPMAYTARVPAERMAVRLSETTGSPHVSTVDWKIDYEDPTRSEPVGWTWARFPI